MNNNNLENNSQQRHKNQQSLILKITELPLEITDFSEFLNTTLDLVANSFPVEYAEILELSPNQASFRLIAGFGWSREWLGQTMLSVNSQCQIAYTFRNKQPVIVTDLLLDTRFSGSPFLHNQGIISGITVIIPGRKIPFGVLGIHSTRTNNFNQEDIYFLQVISNIIASAIEKYNKETDLSSFFHLSPDLFCIIGIDGYFQRINPRFQELLGYGDEELLQQSFMSFVHPEDLESTLQEFERLTLGFETIKFENRYRCKNGSYLWLSWNATPHNHEQIYGIARDITEQKEGEVALQESEEKFRQIAENIREIFLIHSLKDRQLLYISPAYEQIFGFARSGLYQNPNLWLNFVHPEDRDRIMKAWQRQIQSIPFNQEYRILRPDKTMKWIWGRSFPVKNTQGQIYRLVSILEDITDRKQAEEKLSQKINSERLFNQIALQIRQSLNLEQILTTAVDQVRSWLQCDRVVIYQINGDGAGMIVAESVREGLTRSLGYQIADRCFVPFPDHSFNHAINNIQQAGLTDCYLKFLERFEVKAKTTTVIKSTDQKTWGLLIAHQCNHTRIWQPNQLKLLEELSVQISIAISQSQLYQQAKFELLERQKAEAALKQLNEELEARVIQRTNELEVRIIHLKQVEEALQRQILKSRLFSEISLKIRQSLQLDVILQTTVTEIQRILQADRVLIYRVLPEGIGYTTTECVLPQWKSILSAHFPEEVFPQQYQQLYQNGKVKAITNIAESYEKITPCLVDFLTEWQVKAKLVVPILQQQNLWGFMIAHQCSQSRQWTEFEIDLMQQLANQVGVAISQAQLLEAQRESENKLINSLQEKEVLLKEIHHRVKNNLYIISSLLNLQSSYIGDEKIVELFRESQIRIQTMATLHEQLYQSHDLAKINFAEYVQRLVNNLFTSYNNQGKIRAVIRLQSFFLNVETAIPCGLILNELITNSFKHAFVNQTKGEITVYLTIDQEDMIRLTVRDNGSGMSPDFDWRNSPSLGLRLVKILGQQLDSHIELNTSSQGTTFTLLFKELNYQNRV
jgi:PAS domain S-box-containing protein